MRRTCHVFILQLLNLPCKGSHPWVAGERKTNFKYINLWNHSCLPVWPLFRWPSLFGINSPSSGFPPFLPLASLQNGIWEQSLWDLLRGGQLGYRWELGCSGPLMDAAEEWLPGWLPGQMTTEERLAMEVSWWHSFPKSIGLAFNSRKVPAHWCLFIRTPGLCWSTEASAFPHQNPLHRTPHTLWAWGTRSTTWGSSSSHSLH